ncbi:MAG: peptidoglycan recognition protein family protein [Candidatus Udaeobacter sp.]
MPNNNKTGTVIQRTWWRTRDLYQTVRDGDAAWHCMGANRSRIGIEHVGAETDSISAMAGYRFCSVDPLVTRAKSNSTHKHLRPRFYARLQPARWNQLAVKTLWLRALAGHDRCVGAGQCLN